MVLDLMPNPYPQPLGKTAANVLRLSRTGEFNQREIAGLCAITQQRVSAIQRTLRKRGLLVEEEAS